MMKKNERTLGRRGFLILSGAGATSMAFASSAMGREAVNLLDPGNPLIIPQNFKPSIWFTMEANGRNIRMKSDLSKSLKMEYFVKSLHY